MSNFGRLGSAMVSDAYKGQAMQQNAANYEAQASQRELAAQNAEIGKATNDYAIEEAGGIRALAKKAAETAKQDKLRAQQIEEYKLQTARLKATKVSASDNRAAMKAAATAGAKGNNQVHIPTVDAATGEQGQGQTVAYMKNIAETMGATFTTKDGKTAMVAPTGAGYLPTKLADMTSTQREEANKMLARWEGDPNFVTTESSNGTKVFTDKTSGFSVNSDQFMLTANAKGQYEVASMFDLGMITGHVAKGKEEMDINRALYASNDKATGFADVAGQTGPKPTAEETANGQAMLAVDQSGATPSATQVPGAQTAQAVGTPDPASLPQNDPLLAPFDAKEYDLKGLATFAGTRGRELITAGLLKKGLKEGTPEFNKAFEAEKPNILKWAADKQFKLTPTEEPATQASPDVEGPQQVVKPSAPEHWTKSTDYKGSYKPTHPNAEGYSNNYGGYKSHAEYNKAISATDRILNMGKESAESDKLLKRFATDYKKFYDLGIATPAELARYDADMKNMDAERTANNSASARKLNNEAKDAQILDEASVSLDIEVDKGTSPLEAINLTKSQMRKVSHAQRANKLNPDDRKTYKGITGRARQLKFTQEMLKRADLEALETVSPLKRASLFINKYFGDMSTKERAAMIAEQGMGEMVSRTLKEISGTAASDSERATVRSWLLGEKGIDGKEVQRIMNKIQYNLYEEAKGFGEVLYSNSQLGKLQGLKDATSFMKGLTLDKDVVGKIRRVVTPRSGNEY